MKRLTALIIAMVMGTTWLSAEGIEEVAPVVKDLRGRMPEWRHDISEKHPNGIPKSVVFYAELEEGKEAPVKRMVFNELGVPLEEADLIVVAEDSPGFGIWKTTIVPHGVCLWFKENGDVEQVAYYDRGLLHGPMQIFYEKSKVQHLTPYKENQPHGKLISYFKNGKVSSEGYCREGKLEGDFARYYESGEREALIPYQNGEMNGEMIEWYENGSERAHRHFVNGKLHSPEKQPAVLIYTEDHSIKEVQDFRNGLPFGDHIQFHSNERKSYHVHFRDGNKHGKEKWFDSHGKLSGEREYNYGKKMGRHWKKHPNGTMAYLSTFDKKGNLKESVREFDEQGQLIAEYYELSDDKLDGSYKTWYSSGQIKAELNYDKGESEGKQREYFESGNPSLTAFYRNHQKEGEFKQWHEEDKLAFQGTYRDGKEDGAFLEWYSSGQLKVRKTFKMGLHHGDHREWYKNGQSKLSARFDKGHRDGPVRSWDEEGHLLFEGDFGGDHPVKTHIWYFPDGTKKEEIFFVTGKKEGQRKEYYPNGQLKSLQTYKEDLLEGDVAGYYETGELAFSRTFHLNKPIGEQKEFFSKAMAPDHDVPQVLPQSRWRTRWRTENPSF